MSDPTTDLFAAWRAGCERGELLFRRCPTCGASTYAARRFCSECSSEMEFVSASGLGTVFSITSVRRSTVQGAGRDAPFPLCFIELDEGPLVLTTVRFPVPIGTRVTAEFDRVDGVATAVFRQLESPAE